MTAGEDAGDIFKNVSGRSGLCGTGYVDQRGTVSGAEGKIQLLRDGAGTACGWNRSDLHGKNRTVSV